MIGILAGLTILLMAYLLAMAITWPMRKRRGESFFPLLDLLSLFFPKYKTYSRCCPYTCGTQVSIVRRRGEPVPHHFTCPVCRREFGDLDKMTAAQRKSVQRINEDCARAEKLSNLEQLQAAVSAIYRYDDYGNVAIFEKGKLCYLNKDGERVTMATYSGVTTKAGELRLAKLCAEWTEELYPQFRWRLTGNGLTWS